MPVEQPTYIDTLVPEWPLGSDPQSAGDDHIRMIKQVLQNTFPNAASPLEPNNEHISNAMNCYALVDVAEPMPRHAKIRDWVTNDGKTLPVMSLSAAAHGVPSGSRTNFGITWGDIYSMIMPVGHILMTKKTGNPADWLGFGTWVQRVGFVAGAGSITDSAGMAGTIAVGEHKGNWRVQESMIVEADCTVSLTTSSTGRHRHEMPYNASDQEGGVSIQGSSSASSGNLSTKMSEAPDHSHTVNGTVKFGAGTATSGTQYTPPRHAVYVWERTV